MKKKLIKLCNALLRVFKKVINTIEHIVHWIEYSLNFQKNITRAISSYNDLLIYLLYYYKELCILTGRIIIIFVRFIIYFALLPIYWHIVYWCTSFFEKIVCALIFHILKFLGIKDFELRKDLAFIISSFITVYLLAFIIRLILSIFF